MSDVGLLSSSPTLYCIMYRGISQFRHGKWDSANQWLRKRTTPVDAGNIGDARETLTDLIDTMRAQPLAVGLAANQIGSPLRMAAFKVGGQSDDLLVVLNPFITSRTGKCERKRESCMSVWGMAGDVTRRHKVSLSYDDLELTHHTEDFTGFTARIMQHEVDHLDGVLYVDHLDSEGLYRTDIFDSYTP